MKPKPLPKYIQAKMTPAEKRSIDALEKSYITLRERMIQAQALASQALQDGKPAQALVNNGFKAEAAWFRSADKLEKAQHSMRKKYASK